MNEEKVSYYAVIPADVRYDAKLTPNAKLLYGEITALCNAKGYCWASNNYFAELYGVSRDTASRWVRSLVARGYIKSEVIYEEGTKIIKERRLRLTTPIDKNSDTYSQNRLYPIDKNDDRVSTKKSIPIVKNDLENNTVNNKLNITDNILSDFEILWSLYPNKKGKPAALKAYEKAVKKGTTFEEVQKGILAFKAECEIRKTETRYIPHGSTWFNQERWNDEYNTEVERSERSLTDARGQKWDLNDPSVI